MWLGNFQPGRKELAYLGKMTKGKEAKGGSKKVESRSLGEEKNKSQPSRTPRTKKSANGLLKKEPQKKKIMRNKKGTSHRCCWHNIGSGTQ